jgi:hypothetical protein
MAATALLADRTIKIGEYPPLEVELADGRRIERHVLYAKGAWQNPMSVAEQEAKVASLIDPVLGASRRREIEAVVATLEEQADVRALTRLLASGGQGKAA